MFLGEIPEDNILMFKVHSTKHDGRLKSFNATYIFCKQFCKRREINVAVKLIFISSLNDDLEMAAFASSASANDLLLLKHKRLNKKVIEKATNGLKCQICYLSEKLIGLSFSPVISKEVKQKMIERLKREAHEKSMNSLANVNDVGLKLIKDFVISKTLNFFQLYCKIYFLAIICFSKSIRSISFKKRHYIVILFCVILQAY